MRSAVDKALPAASRFLSRFVYTTSYTFSYGVVFPAVLLAKSIPSDNAFVHGLVDGAKAASDTVDQWKSSRARCRRTGVKPLICRSNRVGPPSSKMYGGAQTRFHETRLMWDT